jgi:ankyrin repeat protein
MLRERSEFGDNRSYHSRGSRSFGLVDSAASGEFNYGDEPEIDYDAGATVLYRCIEGKDWDGALSRLELAPVEAKTWVSRHENGTDKIRWRLLPVHAVCIFRAPLALIEALIEVYEDGPKMRDDQGMLPIHLACRNGASKGVVLTLLQAFPEALEVRDRKGRLPVDLVQASNSQNKENVLTAIRKFQKENLRVGHNPHQQNVPPATVSAPSSKTGSVPSGSKIGEPSPMAATTAIDNRTDGSLLMPQEVSGPQREVDYEHRTVLFRMILKKDWKQAAARAAAYPDEAATWIVTKGFNGNLRFLPLHKACVLSPPSDEFGELLKAFPQAAESADQDGWLPLHCACFYGAPASAMNHLLKTYPRAASHKDDEGRLPLHYACLKGASPEVVDALLKVSPKAAMAKDQEGRLALHHACSKGAPEEVIDALLKAFPKGAQSKDDQGRLPLHHACRRNSSERVIRTLIRVYPRAAQIKDDQDKLAVHYACNHGGSLETIQLLMNTYPESINVRNSFGHTPLTEVENLNDEKMMPVLRFLKEFKKEYDVNAADNDVESQVTLLKAKVAHLEKALAQFVNISTDLKKDLKKNKDPTRVLDDFAEKIRDASVSRKAADSDSPEPISNVLVPHNVDASVAQTSLGNSHSTGTTPNGVRAVSKPRSRSRSQGRSQPRNGTPSKMRLFRR